jgi:hypothetical protein
MKMPVIPTPQSGIGGVLRGHKCTLTLTDSKGNTGSKNCYFEVFNGYPPVISSISATPNPAAVNTDVFFNASFTDQDKGDIHTAQWYWGEEEGEYYYEGVVTEAAGTGTVSGMIRFTAPGFINGFYPICIVVRDNTGEESTEDILVKVVQDNPPVVNPITLTPANPVPVNTIVTTQASFTDIDAGDTHTASWDWGDGSNSTGTIDAGTLTGIHTYGAEGQYVCKLNVTDSKGVSDFAEVAIEVTSPVQTGPKVVLKDSLGNGIPGATVQYYSSGWKEFGVTDGNGETTLAISPGTYTFRINYGGATVDRKQDIRADPEVEFRTVKSRIELKDSTGAALDPGTAQYYAGGWKEYGATSMGIVEKELLPGNYTFRMSYAGASIDKKQDIGVNPTVTFQAIKSRIELKDSTGAALDPGTAQYYAGGWKEYGATSSGFVERELLPGNYTFRMSYAGASIDKKQDIEAGSLIGFATKKVVLELRNSSNQLIDSGIASYYAGGWKEIGPTSGGTVQLELLPLNYTFRMNYQGKSTDIKQDIGQNLVVVFNAATPMPTVKLLDSQGNPIAGGVVQYYASGWKDFGTTDSLGVVSKDILPGTYTFRMGYAGASVDKKQDIGVNPVVEFQTVNTQVKLKDGNDAPLDTGTVQYYAGGWKEFGTTSGGTVQKDLLPGNYTFRMGYASASIDKKQDIGANPVVEFRTVNTQVRLVNSTGIPLDTGTLQYYTGGWKDFGTTSGGTVQKDLLPGNYSFRMTYAGASVDKKQDTGLNSVLEFQTGTVYSDSGKCVSYYAGGWKQFNTQMELLPQKYKFRFSDGSPDKEYTIISGTINHIY